MLLLDSDGLMQRPRATPRILFQIISRATSHCGTLPRIVLYHSTLREVHIPLHIPFIHIYSCYLHSCYTLYPYIIFQLLSIIHFFQLHRTR